MNNQFESFVETLRCMGVKTLTIEFQQTTAQSAAPFSGTPPKKTNEKEEKTYTAPPEQTAQPAAQLATQPAAEAKKADKDIFDTHGQPENKAVKKITSTEKAKPVKDEPPKEVPPKEVPPKETSAVSAKSPYDKFWAINEEDDGGVEQGEQRRTLIRVMTRDDIIRINNDCELGIDTDQPLDQLRDELATCF
jgi:hypothetical protein